MTDMSTLRTSVEGIADAVEASRTVQAKRLAEFGDRLEALEAQADRPKGTISGESDATKDQLEHRDLFLKWIRRPHEGTLKRQLEDAQAEIEHKAGGTKAVTIGTGSAGGFAVPELIASDVERRVRQLNPFRELVRVVQAGSSDYAHLVSKNTAGSGWVGEGDTRSETSTSELLERRPTFGTIYSYPKASEEALQDIFFNVQSWLVEEIADGFAAAEADAIVSGNGTNKPTGFTSGAVTTADDSSPERAAGALQYLTLTSSSPVSITADDLVDMSLSIKDRYMLDGQAIAWVMRRTTAAIVRKLKDPVTGTYLWQPSLQLGQPDMLLGHPVRLTDAMPAATAGNFPIAFGNWRRGYVLADRAEMRLTVDDNISTPGQVKFYARRRLGGVVLNHECLRLLKYDDT